MAPMVYLSSDFGVSATFTGHPSLPLTEEERFAAQDNALGQAIDYLGKKQAEVRAQLAVPKEHERVDEREAPAGSASPTPAPDKSERP